jgi:O-antigen ligase
MSGSHNPGRVLSGATHLLTASGIVLVAILLAVTALAFGGARLHIALPLYFAGGALWIVLAGLWFLSYRRGHWNGDLLDLSVLLFLAYAAWSWHAAVAPYPARLEWLWISAYAAVFLFARYGFRDRSAAVWILGMVVLLAAAVCLYGLLHRGQPTYPIWGEMRHPGYGIRMSGTFGSPNNFANFLAMAAGAALFLGFHGRIPWPVRIFSFYLAAMLTAGIFFSLSRGGWAGWTAMVAVVAFFIIRDLPLRWLYKAWIFPVAAAGVYAIIMANPDMVARLNVDPFKDFRVLFAKDAITLWKTSPVTGTGPATFEFLHPRIQAAEVTTYARYTHNDYLNLLSDYGAVGALLVLLFLGLYVATLWRESRLPVVSERHQLLLRCGWAALAVMAVHSALDFNFHIPACALLFFLLAGFGVMRPRHEEATGLQPIHGLLMAAALLAAGLTFHGAWVTRAGENLARVPQAELAQWPADRVLATAATLDRVDPENAGQYVRLAQALMDDLVVMSRNAPFPGSELATQREQLGEAVYALLEKAHAANPLDDSILVRKALVYDLMERFPEAYLMHQQAMQLQPTNRFFRKMYGIHLMLRGELEAARDELQKMLRIPPGREEEEEAYEQARAALRLIRRIQTDNNPR